jgi:cytochrome c peroxidase
VKRKVIWVALACAILALTVVSVAQAAGDLTPKEQLGKMLFFDENLSVNQNQSCATCHAPEAGWVGPDSNINTHGAVYEGSIPGAFGDRKPPSSAYATFAPILHVDKKGTFVGGNFWDGRATGEILGSPAAEQAKGPFLNPKEQALGSAADVIAIVRASDYADLFRAVWGESSLDEVGRAYDCVGYSIAAYEASSESNTFTSKFDYSRKGQARLTQQELRGWALFNGKGKCSKCHISTPSGSTPPLFTDFTYDNLGVPKNLENPVYADNPGFIDPGLGGFLASRLEYASYVAENMGKHKVPTLRNVDLRPTPTDVKAYGHNGYFKSLEEIVHFYNTRDVAGAGWMGEPWPAPEVAENVNTAELGNLGLKADEEAAIVAFLKTLSDGYTP